ncbi:MAG: hypothetical protein KAR01_02430 [Desulfocapsa sp.]|nr:hypothetical protein [Desulfocapsa sp.]
MGLFNKMIYGDPNKQDLVVKENLSPIQAFFEVVKTKFWDLCKVNFMFLLFMIPTIVWSWVNLQVISAENIIIDSYIQVYFIGLIPCLIFMGLGLPSLNYIVKSFAKEVHVWLFEDFKAQLKENWKQSILYMLILGIYLAVGYYGLMFYSLNYDQVIGAAIFRGILYFLLLYVLVSTLYIYPLMVTFELKLKHLIRNAVLLTIGKLPQTLLVLLILLVIPVSLFLLTIVWAYGTIILVVYYALIGFSMSALIINAYTNQVFEKIIVASGNREAEKKVEVERKEKK